MWMVVALLYGAGLRLQECLELRVKDLDFDRHEIVVRRGKGQKDRRTVAAHAFMWLAVTVYIWSVWVRMNRVEADIRALRK